MIGGEQDAVTQCEPLMNCYSQQCKLMGGAGAGQNTKAANQILVAGQTFGVVEAMIYGHKAGLPLDQLIELLSKGAGNCFSLVKYGPRMLQRDFEPGFYVEHFVKDLGIVLEESKRMGISLPSTALTAQFYHAHMAQGGSRDGIQGLLKTLEQLNNTQVKKYEY